jgi:hypothetical protein
MAKYSNEKVSMIEFLGNLKFFGTFHLNLIGELVGYSQNFQLQEVVVNIPHITYPHSMCRISHTNISTYPHTNIYFTPYYLYCLRVFFIAPIFGFVDIPLSC